MMRTASSHASSQSGSSFLEKFNLCLEDWILWIAALSLEDAITPLEWILNSLLHQVRDADSWVWSQALHLQINLEQSYSSKIILEQSYMLKPKLQKTTRVCHTVVTIILQPLDMRVPQQPTKIQQFLPQS